jgi:hypothetical protein
MEAVRYLTKSRFKLALECPTKLYYTQKKNYPDRKIDNSFLQALAQGGYQVGELAKYYFPGGTNIEELEHDAALAKTDELMKQADVIIYEAAFKFGNLFVRADIVHKRGDTLLLYEVKAKSYEPNNPKKTMFKDGAIVSKWEPYLYDVAFQKYVIERAYPALTVKAHLMVANKESVCLTDGLNQRFFITKENGRTKTEVIGDPATLTQDPPLLHIQPVDGFIAHLETKAPFEEGDPKSFYDWIHHYEASFVNDTRLQGVLKSHCRDCEFKTNPQEDSENFKNGYKECWELEKGFTAEQFLKPSILQVWDFRKKNEYITNGKYFQSDLSRIDLEAKPTVYLAEDTLSRVDRQDLQLQKSLAGDDTPFVNLAGLRNAFQGLVYPIHFIDFETTTVAIPFNSGRHPYEQVAFQFSHHTVQADGTIAHAGEWISMARGKFPNFDFVRQLKAQLAKDDGTIFRYAAHENTILVAIYRQLMESSEPDRAELCDWIQTITKAKEGTRTLWEGQRNMIDLRDWVLKHYYAPSANGSNSIKDILPAMLNGSPFLKAKYSQPIYGSAIASLNFSAKQWIELDAAGKVINPYKQLEPVFAGIDEDLLADLVAEDDAELRDGGAAMIAFAQMQFSQMSDMERDYLKNSLLKYCELDTLAMVMIWEGWKAMLAT